MPPNLETVSLHLYGHFIQNESLDRLIALRTAFVAACSCGVKVFCLPKSAFLLLTNRKGRSTISEVCVPNSLFPCGYLDGILDGGKPLPVGRGFGSPTCGLSASALHVMWLYKHVSLVSLLQVLLSDMYLRTCTLLSDICLRTCALLC